MVQTLIVGVASLICQFGETVQLEVFETNLIEKLNLRVNAF